MKYAFLILAHTDPQQVTALVRALNDDRFDIYIHLDSKADCNSYRDVARAAPSSTVVFLDKRHDIRWGGITMVRAMIDLYRRASQNGCYERYTMLSGLDFPLLTADGIAEYFASNAHHELIMGNPLIGDSVKKVSTYNFLEIRSRYLRAATRLLLRHLPVKSPRVLIDGKRCSVYFAPQWHSLTANCVTWILDTLDTHPHLWHYFKFSYAPDELLIPTLVFNSPFKAATLACDLPSDMHYNDKCATHYLDYEPIVRVLTTNDFQALIHSGKPFCRKLQTGTSDQLVERLIEHQRSAP